MKYVIVEDEAPAARRLERLIGEVAPSYQFLQHAQSLQELYDYLEEGEHPDLFFLDIHLGDGLIFEAVQKLPTQSLLIFTTAYDQYALKAFESNSIDYLLKPVKEDDLKRAFTKIENRSGGIHDVKKRLEELANAIESRQIKNRFLCHLGDQMYFVNTPDVAYFCSEDGLTFLFTFDNKRFIIKESLDVLFPQLDGENFFRINRGMVVAAASIKKISSYFNSRLKLDVHPETSKEIVVARDRVKSFKSWLGE